MTTSATSDGTLAGYRLVRKLAAGSRADVYLGVGSTGSVALKVFAPGISRESVGVELEALGRLDSPHLVRLLDLSSASDDLPILVLERAGRGSVTALLRERENLECGEAVTLLAPIAAVVGELHAVGVAHGKIGATSVYLGFGGEPILLGLGHCTLFEAGGSMAAIDTEPAAALDRDALAALTLGVLACVKTGDVDTRLRELVRWIGAAPRAYEFPGQLEERLFACAESMPIAFSPLPSTASTVPARIAPAEHLIRPTSTVDSPSEQPGFSVPSWLRAALLENPVAALKQRAVTLVHGVRARFWVAAGVIVVALVLAAALIPAAGGAQRAPRSASESVSSTSVPTATAPTAAALPTDQLSTDPLIAAKILLTARTTCIRDLSILCLDHLDQASSGAFASDAALIQQIQEGGEIPNSDIAADAVLTLVERMGDTALISVAAPRDSGGKRGPVSILVIRSGAGWRIRDVLGGAQATATPPAPTG